MCHSSLLRRLGDPITRSDQIRGSFSISIILGAPRTPHEIRSAHPNVGTAVCEWTAVQSAAFSVLGGSSDAEWDQRRSAVVGIRVGPFVRERQGEGVDGASARWEEGG